MIFTKATKQEGIQISEQSKSSKDDYYSENPRTIERTMTFEDADTNRIKMDNMYGFGHR